MRKKPSLLISALWATAFPVLALAQPSVVVPPPTPPVGVAQPVGHQPPANVTSAQSSQAGVIAPATMDNAKLTSSTMQPTPDLISVVLPESPERPPTAVLKPTPPACAAKPKKKQGAPNISRPSAQITPSEKDPFAGLVSVPVSDSQLNRFVFQEPVEGLYFPEGSPLPECPKDASAQDPCKPVFLNGRRMVLIQFRAGAQGPVQMLTHLHSGRMVTLNLMPARGPGAVIRLDGAEDGASDARLSETKTKAKPSGMDATEQDVALLAQFARGDIPAGFEVSAVGKPRRYDLFDVIPMATWANGSGVRTNLFQVRAFSEDPVAISAGLFRGPNIKAVALDRETITASKPALMYTLDQGGDQ